MPLTLLLSKPNGDEQDAPRQGMTDGCHEAGDELSTKIHRTTKKTCKNRADPSVQWYAQEIAIDDSDWFQAQFFIYAIICHRPQFSVNQRSSGEVQGNSCNVFLMFGMWA